MRRGRDRPRPGHPRKLPCEPHRYAPADDAPGPPGRSAERWTAVVNPAAGRTGSPRLPRVDAARGRLGDRRRDPAVPPTPTDLVTDRPGRVRRRVGVVACGGDGTVRARGCRRRSRRRARHRADRLGQRLRPPTRHPRHDLPAAIATLLDGDGRARRPRPGHRRRRPRGLVHDRRQHRLRRRGQPLGERGRPRERDTALRARRAAHARDLPAAPVPRHRRRRGRRHRGVARRRRQHPHVRERDDDHARAPTCTTACSTCASSGRSGGPTSCARSRGCSAAPTWSTRWCVRGAPPRSPSRHPAPPSRSSSGPVVSAWGRSRPASCPRRRPCKSWCRPPHYETVSVPSMPWARCPGMLQ